ncbi:hypothetical protein NEMIN01_0345 [Nematocida minor]|uniref:uncharacterized protein n=1 Tax=Nematocida minor TaxID=1912983 RepID=UPI002220428A|nr:uncharacterized protein NEMIN01_0345 [Nematocida minor]KAI5189179.1 hypothetical protein NEMIN01_0345 [Nematocida minor]
MILKQKTKQIGVVGVALLLYLQLIACALIESDVLAINKYWQDRISFIDREIKVRKNIFKVVKTIEFPRKRVTLNSADNIELEAVNEVVLININEIEKRRKIFEASINNIMMQTNTIINLYQRLKNSIELDSEKRDEISKEIENKNTEICRMILLVFRANSSVIKEINSYDTYMLKVIDWCVSKKLDVHNLTLFKLARQNKLLATNIIYTLFEIFMGKKKENVEDLLLQLPNVLTTHISSENVSTFMEAIRKDVKEGAANLFQSADAHLHLLCDKHNFKISVLDPETMCIYFNLAKKNLSEEEIRQYINITPEQVVKVVIIEFLMAGDLLDHKENNLFASLGKIIQRMYTQDSTLPSTYEEMQVRREKQNKILDVLSIMWDDYELTKKAEYTEIENLCESNDIPCFDFRKINSSFRSVAWMYAIDAYKPTPETDLGLELHFDMSYTNPMWYICKRCEHINRMAASKNNEHGTEPFAETKDGVLITPDRISAVGEDAACAERMRSCMKAWFTKSAKVIHRKEDSQEYCNLADDFTKYLKIHIEEDTEQKEPSAETDKSELSKSNPLLQSKFSSEESTDTIGL